LNAESNLDNGEFGLLGKNGNFDLKLPFGINALMKPLMKELSKSMMDLDKELKREQQGQSNNLNGEKKVSPRGNFSIHIGMPGQKPIKLVPNGMNVNPQVVREKKVFSLPKISGEEFEKSKEFPREEPKTNVRRLADKVIYEIEVPGVGAIEKVDISSLEEGIEIKAIGKDVVYQKFIDVVLPLRRYELRKGLVVLELGLK
tara:strand:+ start:707 stop:1309 length:603 start_codon:yes stop_codon:yes gene_type:complete